MTSLGRRSMLTFVLVRPQCLTAVNMLIVVAGNKRKRKRIEEGAADQLELGDENPHYLYYL